MSSESKFRKETDLAYLFVPLDDKIHNPLESWSRVWSFPREIERLMTLDGVVDVLLYYYLIINCIIRNLLLCLFWGDSIQSLTWWHALAQEMWANIVSAISKHKFQKPLCISTNALFSLFPETGESQTAATLSTWLLYLWQTCNIFEKWTLFGVERH